MCDCCRCETIFYRFFLLFSSRRLVVTQYNIFFHFFFNHTLTRARLICAMTTVFAVQEHHQRQQTRDRLRFLDFFIYIFVAQSIRNLKSMYECCSFISAHFCCIECNENVECTKLELLRSLNVFGCSLSTFFVPSPPSPCTLCGVM